MFLWWRPCESLKLFLSFLVSLLFFKLALVVSPCFDSTYWYYNYYSTTLKPLIFFWDKKEKSAFNQDQIYCFRVCTYSFLNLFLLSQYRCCLRLSAVGRQLPRGFGNRSFKVWELNNNVVIVPRCYAQGLALAHAHEVLCTGDLPGIASDTTDLAWARVSISLQSAKKSVGVTRRMAPTYAAAAALHAFHPRTVAIWAIVSKCRVVLTAL